MFRTVPLHPSPPRSVVTPSYDTRRVSYTVPGLHSNLGGTLVWGYLVPHPYVRPTFLGSPVRTSGGVGERCTDSWPLGVPHTYRKGQGGPSPRRPHRPPTASLDAGVSSRHRDSVLPVRPRGLLPPYTSHCLLLIGYRCWEDWSHL